MTMKHLISNNSNNKGKKNKELNALQYSGLLALLMSSIPVNAAYVDGNLKISGDYFLFGLGSGAAMEDKDDYAVSGIGRVTANWTAFEDQSGNVGQVQLRVDHKHRLTNDVPLMYIFDNLGGYGIIQPAFSDIGLRLTNLYWRQEFNQQNTELMVGFLDSTDYVDTYALGNPYAGFSNLQFSTGVGTIPIPDESTLGFTLRHITSDNFYGLVSFSDALADSTEPFDGLSHIVRDNQYFKSLEIGWIGAKDAFYVQNIHMTLWHSDGKQEQETENYGVNVSATYLMGDWMPFVRAGVSHGDESLYESSFTFGTGYLGFDGNTLGMAVGWAKPNLPMEIDEIVNAEVYYRMQFGALSLTPNLQYVSDLAWNPSEENALIFGLRARLTF